MIKFFRVRTNSGSEVAFETEDVIVQSVSDNMINTPKPVFKREWARENGTDIYMPTSRVNASKNIGITLFIKKNAHANIKTIISLFSGNNLVFVDYLRSVSFKFILDAVSNPVWFDGYHHSCSIKLNLFAYEGIFSEDGIEPVTGTVIYDNLFNSQVFDEVGKTLNPVCDLGKTVVFAKGEISWHSGDYQPCLDVDTSSTYKISARIRSEMPVKVSVGFRCFNTDFDESNRFFAALEETSTDYYKDYVGTITGESSDDNEHGKFLTDTTLACPLIYIAQLSEDIDKIKTYFEYFRVEII